MNNLETRKAELREYIAIMNNALDDGESARIAEQLLECIEVLELYRRDPKIKVVNSNEVNCLPAAEILNKIGSADE